MRDNKCTGCSEYKRCRDSYASWIFVIIGMIASIAMRIVPVYGKIAWYIGVIGFFVFFIYKYKVFKSRSEIIEHNDLIKKIGGHENLTEEDYDMVSKILCGISSVKERINYLFIFVLSAVALLIAAYFDLNK
ncbi:MAG: hypothetical protein ABIH89_06240 [Elusimicrobiota bacterium]